MIQRVVVVGLGLFLALPALASEPPLSSREQVEVAIGRVGAAGPVDPAQLLGSWKAVFHVMRTHGERPMAVSDGEDGMPEERFIFAPDGALALGPTKTAQGYWVLGKRLVFERPTGVDDFNVVIDGNTMEWTQSQGEGDSRIDQYYRLQRVDPQAHTTWMAERASREQPQVQWRSQRPAIAFLPAASADGQAVVACRLMIRVRADGTPVEYAQVACPEVLSAHVWSAVSQWRTQPIERATIGSLLTPSGVITDASTVIAMDAAAESGMYTMGLTVRFLGFDRRTEVANTTLLDF